MHVKCSESEQESMFVSLCIFKARSCPLTPQNSESFRSLLAVTLEQTHPFALFME